MGASRSRQSLFRPSAFARAGMALAYLGGLISSVASMGRTPGVVAALVFGISQSLAVLFAGFLRSGIEVDRASWVVRGVLTHCAIATDEIAGVSFESGLAVVTKHGFVVQTTLIQGARPRRQTREQLVLDIGAAQGCELRHIRTRAELDLIVRHAGRKLDDAELGAALSPTVRVANRYVWWQWLLIAGPMVAAVIAAVSHAT